VTQDQNQLNGEYAEVDLKSGVSRLLGAPPGGEGKVKGLVLPGSVPEPGG
jgi:lipopolysaccharide export system protein LptA